VGRVRLGPARIPDREIPERAVELLPERGYDACKIDFESGIEVMGRVREPGSLEDCVDISRRVRWVRPVIDFAHMHATSDGAFVEVEPFREALALVDAVLEPDAPFHIHFSDIATRTATRRSACRTGKARSAPTRCVPRSTASSEQPR